MEHKIMWWSTKLCDGAHNYVMEHLIVMEHIIMWWST